MRVVLDIEADGLYPENIWCIVTKDIDNETVRVFTGKELQEDFPVWISEATQIITHNGIEYDVYHINRLLGTSISDKVIYDTLVVGRVLDSGRSDGHSLESYGKLLGFPKQEFSDWSKLTPEMIEYCKNDVELNYKLYRHFERIISRNGKAFRQAIDIEHRVQCMCLEMSRDGFKFDIHGLDKLDEEIASSISVLDEKIKGSFPDKVEHIQLKTKVKTKVTPFNPGSVRQIVERCIEAGWRPTERTKTYITKKRNKEHISENLEKYGWKVNEVNMGTLPSVEDVKRCLNTHQIVIKDITLNTKNELKNDQESITTITLNDLETTSSNGVTNLVRNKLTEWLKNKEDVASFVKKSNHLWLIIVTPQETYVDFSAACATQDWDGTKNTQMLSQLTLQLEAFALLIEHILLSARRRTLAEWRASYNPRTECIHGRFNPLGTVTQRCSHSNPNMGNIATKKTIKYNSERLRNLATDLGGRMRSFWMAPDGGWLVGTDMESAHLRIFAHLIDDKEFTQSLISGDKKLGTDPHSVNKRRLGDLCVDRDRAKTFIFSFLNGAGAGKVAEIFGCTLQEAAQVLDGYVKAYPGLEKLKQVFIPADVERGYFVGIDGRLVRADSEHKMIGMYLQNMESVLMKYAWADWDEKIKKLKLPARCVNWVHDEWVTEVQGDKDIAEEVGRIQSNSIKEVAERFSLRCPMSGEFKIGRNWLEVH